MQPPTLVVFPSQLGWMAIVAEGPTVKRLTFGHRTAAAAKATSKNEPDIIVQQHDAKPLDRSVQSIIDRLQAYASGKPDGFRDVRVDQGSLSEFQCRVLTACRKIPYGSTISYAELAAQAGHPGAARAVGNCMAGNRIPLIVPCHRVVCSNGQLGAYSAPGGVQMKRRLLDLEMDGSKFRKLT
jgi:methylated-DNA-[protein]-cysteine S-methyltransferase